MFVCHDSQSQSNLLLTYWSFFKEYFMQIIIHRFIYFFVPLSWRKKDGKSKRANKKICKLNKTDEQQKKSGWFFEFSSLSFIRCSSIYIFFVVVWFVVVFEFVIVCFIWNRFVCNKKENSLKRKTKSIRKKLKKKEL